MSLPVNKLPMAIIKEDIKAIEEEVSCTEINVQGMEPVNLKLELLALDYQSSVTKKCERKYNGAGLEKLLEDPKYNQLGWWIYDPYEVNQDKEYKLLELTDLIEVKQYGFFG